MTAARVTKPPTDAPDVSAFGRPVKRYTIDEYHRLVDAGVFRGGRKFELIRGLILEKPVPGPPHCYTTRQLTRLFYTIFSVEEWVIGVQDSITLADSEPEPDVSVSRGPVSAYTTRHPGPADLVLVVEVAHSSIDFDRGVKLRLYAESKVSQYWIVDVEARTVDVYTHPSGGKNPVYRTKAEYGPADAVPVVVGGTALGSIPVKDVLP